MTPKVLVVDDEEEYRALAESVLGGAGFSVAVAANGAAARAACAKHKPDVLLLDVMLPDTTGFELALALHKDGSRAPVLFCSVRSAASALAEGLRAGSVDYVLKPFDPDDLLARVRAALRAPGR